MVNISQLPRDPIQALEAVLAIMVGSFGGAQYTIQELCDSKSPFYAELITNVTITKKSASRIQDETVRNLTLQFLAFEPDEKLSSFGQRASKVLEAVIALRLDDHYISIQEVVTYDVASLSQSEKEDIRLLMAQARALTNNSTTLSDGHKRRVIHRIALVENELYKDSSRFGAFMAAAYEVSSLVRQFGSDIQPIADAIERARTITEKKVVGYQQIEADPKPKALPKPEDGAA
jgi:hypothetical protein